LCVLGLLLHARNIAAATKAAWVATARRVLIGEASIHPRYPGGQTASGWLHGDGLPSFAPSGAARRRLPSLLAKRAASRREPGEPADGDGLSAWAAGDGGGRLASRSEFALETSTGFVDLDLVEGLVGQGGSLAAFERDQHLVAGGRRTH